MWNPDKLADLDTLALYADLVVTPSKETARQTEALNGVNAGSVRDPRTALSAVLAARRRPMSERLELALSWNALSAELREGMRATGQGADISDD